MVKHKKEPDLAQKPIEPEKDIEQFMKNNNYVWDEELKTYKEPGTVGIPDISENPTNYKNYIPLLKMLHDNKSKIEALLSSKKASEYQYQIKGKRSTKTIFISVNLINLINSFSTENTIPLSTIFETAIVQFLINKGYEDKIKGILSESP